MKVAKLDANGNVVLGQDGKPVMIEVPDAVEHGAQLLTADEAEKRAQEARKKEYDAKKATERMLADEKKAREELEAKLVAKEKAEKEAKLQQLPPDQQVQARMTEMEHQLAQSRAQIVEVQRQSAEHVRRVGLVAYRERALRDVPEEVHNLVFGDSEEDIDRAVDNARRTYAELEAKLAQRFAGATQQNGAALQSQHAPHAPQFTQQGFPQHPGAAQPQFVQPAAPPSPYYVPPVPPQYAQAPGMFPTPTNPLQTPDPTQQGEMNLSELTSEQAVRSGRYGGEMRDRIHGALKGQMRYPGALGSQPRHWGGQPMANHVPQPNGVMQPQGFPTGPAQQPQMYAQPQPQPQYAPQPQLAPMPVPQAPVPQAAPPQNAGRAAAMEAVARTHMGGNAVMGDNVGAQEALTQAHQFAQQRGIQSPQQAFGQRFAPSPPIVPGSH